MLLKIIIQMGRRLEAEGILISESVSFSACHEEWFGNEIVGRPSDRPMTPNDGFAYASHQTLAP